MGPTSHLSLEQLRQTRRSTRASARSVETTSSAWSPASASGYATAAAKPRSRVNAAGRGRPKKGASWWDYLKPVAKIGLAVTLATSGVIAGLEAVEPAWYTQNRGYEVDGVTVVPDWSLKSSVEPFVSAVRPFVEPVYEFDWCKGLLADDTGGTPCSLKAWRNAKEDAKNIARMKKHNAHIETRDFEEEIADHVKRAQDGLYKEQMSVGKHLTTTRAYPQKGQDFNVVYIAVPRDEDRARVALGIVYFEMAASNEKATEAERKEARLEMENAIAAIKIKNKDWPTGVDWPVIRDGRTVQMLEATATFALRSFEATRLKQKYSLLVARLETGEFLYASEDKTLQKESMAWFALAWMHDRAGWGKNHDLMGMEHIPGGVEKYEKLLLMKGRTAFETSLGSEASISEIAAALDSWKDKYGGKLGPLEDKEHMQAKKALTGLRYELGSAPKDWPSGVNWPVIRRGRTVRVVYTHKKFPTAFVMYDDTVVLASLTPGEANNAETWVTNVDNAVEAEAVKEAEAEKAGTFYDPHISDLESKKKIADEVTKRLASLNAITGRRSSWTRYLMLPKKRDK